MANQYVNKVDYGGDTLIDLTSDTVTASTLLSGYTAHDRSGAPIVGVAVSGGYTVNFSTTNPDLYGATITIKQGSTVIGTVAFDNTGSASYTLSNPGTYTWSVTLEGETYTDTFVVAAPEVYIETTFVYRDWLVAGGLNPSDYADLPAVLADEEAVRQLMTIHAAVDYLASFESTDASVVTILNDNFAAKWISLTDYAMDVLEAAYGTLMGTIGKYGYGEWGITDATTTPPTWGALGNVPVMTSNTAPYGEVTASSAYNSEARLQGWTVFSQKDDGTYEWYSAVSDANPWVQYKFTNPVCAKRVRVKSAGGWCAGTWEVYGSNDGSTWSNSLGSLTFTSESVAQDNYATLTNDEYYLYYRVKRTQGSASGGYNSIMRIVQFYGRTLKVSVPKMSGNTTPYGEASLYHGWSDNTGAYKSFDQITSNDYSQIKNTSNSDVGRFVYEFPSPVAITMVAMMDNAWAYDANLTGNIQYSDDGTTWTDTNVTLALANTVKTAVLSAIGVHKFWGMYFNTGKWLSNHSVYSVTITTLQFYGKDYSEREWDTSHPRRYLYDHGVELEALTGHASGTASVTEEAAQIKVYCGSNSNSKCEWNSDEKIDITDYNLIRAVSGLSAIYASGFSAFLAVASAKSGDFIVGQTGFAYAGITSENAQNNHSFDISSINGEYYIGVGRANIVITETIEELWLE